jgi:uncharacterized protein (TIGR02231 family)
MKKAFLWLVLLGATAYAQKPVFTTAKPTAATVYFNAAEITERATVTLPAGTSEVVVKNVADYLYESTVQIGAPGTLTVLSVQFTNSYISEFEPDPSSPVLQKVRDSITVVQKELEKVRTLRISEQTTLQLLDKAAQQYGNQTGLSVAELTKMVDYYKGKRNEVAVAINTFNEKEIKLNQKLTELNSKLTVTEKNTEKTSLGKLVLQVMNDVAGPVDLNITYLTTNASWSPFYDLRADGTAQPINMLYKAQVVQNTGIDWKKVKLTLSSGTPNQNSQAPLLSAWLLRFGQIMQYYNNAAVNMIQGQVPGLNVKTEELDEVVISGYGRKDKQGVDDFTSVSENQLAITFDIDIPYDILSNGKRHSVTLKEIKLPATYRHYTAPKVEKEAFLLAELSDYSKYNLLRGEANIIFDGMYIGKTFIDPNQVTDTLNLSMGRDKKISVKREKVVDKSGTKFLSGYKEQTFTYEITIRNNKKDAAEIMVKDQYPISTDKEIEVELLQSDKAAVNAETGILTWQLKLAPGETKKVRISYRIKYPKDKVIENL